MTTLLNPAEWEKVGRGKEFHFFATDDEVQNWLETLLPEKYSPFWLVGIDVLQEGKKIYVHKPYQTEIKNFKITVESSIRHQFWICSGKLTPDLNISLLGSDRSSPFFWSTDSPSNPWRIDGVAFINGLISLNHGAKKNEIRLCSVISMLDMIINRNTKEIRQNGEYVEIYENFRKEIKKSLIYSTIVCRPDGSCGREILSERMTEGAYQKAKEGFRFWNVPGKLIKKK